MRHLIAYFVVAFLSVGCASYRTPGGPALLAELTGAAATASVEQPSPQFPVNVVAVRVQAGGYQSRSTAAYGKGRYSVIVPPELLTSAQVQALAQWPQVSKVAIFDPALLPEQFDTLADLRLAAAKMQADVLLVYTIATSFEINGQPLAPAHKLALGDRPVAGAAIRADATLAYVDVRTGYLYGQTQASAAITELADAWSSATALDARRLAAEQQALAALLAAAPASWTGIVSRY